MRRHYLVSGHVQGVGFRAFVQRLARAQAIGGSTRNLSDGRVEIIAFGESQSMLRFEAELKRGPGHARVDALKVTELDASVELQESDERFLISENGDTPWKF